MRYNIESVEHHKNENLPKSSFISLDLDLSGKNYFQYMLGFGISYIHQAWNSPSHLYHCEYATYRLFSPSSMQDVCHMNLV